MIPGHLSNHGTREPDRTVSGTFKPTPKRLHELKINEEFFGRVATGEKRAEIRKNDREYEKGDYLLLTCNTDGSQCLVQVTDVLHDHEFTEITEGYCVLSIKLVLRP